MKNLGTFLLVTVALLTSLPALAATMRAGHTLLESLPIENDVYLAGGKVVVEGEIGGDAVVAGGRLLLNAPVAKDLLMAGGSLLINGPVGGDIRVAGGDITISQSVAEDLIVAGGSVTISRGATIGGDLLVAGGKVIIEGQVKGNADIVGGEIVFNGVIEGNARLRAIEILSINGRVAGHTVFAAPQVTLDSAAGFGADIDYWQEVGPIDFSEVEIAGTAIFNPELRIGGEELARHFPDGDGMALFGIWLIFSILSGALFILVLVLLAPNFFSKAAEPLQESFWKNAGIGFLYFVATPVVALLLMLSVIGLPLGLFVLFGYFFSIIFAVALTAIVFAKWLQQRKTAEWGRAGFFFTSLGLFVALKVLSMVPLLGWLLVAILVCGAFGALMVTEWKIFRQVA